MIKKTIYFAFIVLVLITPLFAKGKHQRKEKSRFNFTLSIGSPYMQRPMPYYVYAEPAYVIVPQPRPIIITPMPRAYMVPVMEPHQFWVY